MLKRLQRFISRRIELRAFFDSCFHPRNPHGILDELPGADVPVRYPIGRGDGRALPVRQMQSLGMSCPHCRTGFLVVDLVITYAHRAQIFRCINCGFVAEVDS
jgi:hypothetical protein